MKVRKNLLSVLIACSLGVAAAEEPAIQQVTINIDESDLSNALIQFTKQTGLQLIYPAGVGATDLKAPRLSGTFSTSDALAKLLKDSGLRYEFISPRTVAIRSPKDGSAASENGAATIGQSGALLSGSSALLFAQSDPSADRQGMDVQESGSSQGQIALEEIVVTAQKRKENLDDVPISMSVLSGDTLDGAKFSSVADALSAVPGVGIAQNTQSGGSTVTIRGVSPGGAMYFGGPTTAYYLDSVPFGLVNEGFAPDSNPYDLDRVEVLRGPQGTLYGAAALNGVVRVLTKAPNLNEFGLKAQTTLSTTEEGDPSYRADMAVNVPLIEGKLAVRVVAGYEDRGGWVDKPNLQQKDVNSGTLNNVRAKIKAQPTDSLSIELSAWHSRDEYDGFTGAERGWTNPSAVNESVLVDYDVFGLSVGYTLPAFTISSTTGYMNLKNDSLYDLSWIGFPYTIGTVNNSDVFSEELILNSSLQGPWRWTAGAMYRDGTENLSQIGGGSLPSTADFPDIESKSLAVFGEVTRTLGSLELTAGLRHFEDKVSFSWPTPSPVLSPTPFFSEANFHATSPRVVLTWHATDDALLYGSYAEGFRSGGSLSPDRVSAGLSALKPDTLKNYEVGTKGEFLDGRIKYDVSVFYMDWQDIQQTRTITDPSGIPVSARLNGDSASGFGTDVGLTLRPIKGLTFGINFGWNDLTLDKDVLSVVGGVNTVFAKAGDRIPYSPEYTGGVSADYAFPLGASGFKAVLSASASYVSSQIFRTILFDQILSETGDNTTIGRVGFSIQSPRHWQVNFFVNNINNEQDVVVPDLFSLVPMRARPRTIGAQFAYEY